jgi:hypothetical protein
MGFQKLYLPVVEMFVLKNSIGKVNYLKVAPKRTPKHQMGIIWILAFALAGPSCTWCENLGEVFLGATKEYGKYWDKLADFDKNSV